MKLQEFISKYCKDITENLSRSKDLLESDDFSYDYYITTDTDEREKVVTTDDGLEVLVRHIIENELPEFKVLYTEPSAEKLYHRYRESFVFLYGEEALLALQNEMLRLKQKVLSVKDFDISDIGGSVDASSFTL